MNAKFFITPIVFIYFVSLSFTTLMAQNPSNVNYQFLPDALATDENLNDFLLPQVSTISYTNGAISFSQPNAKKIFTDISSISNLYQQDSTFEDIVLIKILVTNQTENNFSLQLTQLQSFINLQYLLVSYAYNICNNNGVNCIENELRHKITGTLPITILYQLDLPR